MKKLLVLLVGVMMAVGLCACSGGGQASSSAADDAAAAGDYKTMADAFAVESDATTWSMDESHFVYVFEKDGTATRVVADLTKDQYDQIDAIPFDAADHDEQVEAVVGPLAVSSAEVIVEAFPTDEDAAKLVGKTGQELIDEGFELSGHTSDGKTTIFSAVNGMFEYQVTFDGSIEDDAEDDAALAAVKDMKVVEATFVSLSYNVTKID